MLARDTIPRGSFRMKDSLPDDPEIRLPEKSG